MLPVSCLVWNLVQCYLAAMMVTGNLSLMRISGIRVSIGAMSESEHLGEY